MNPFCFNCNDFNAEFLPENGGLLHRLAWKGHEILRTFDSIDEWLDKPACFGIPVLFPPNRIEDGTFMFHGKKVALPLNEPLKNNHLHGVALKAQWQLQQLNDNTVRMTFKYDENAPEYTHYPFPCLLTLDYTFNPNQLLQTFTVENLSDEPIPAALGFHTVLQCPNTMSITADDNYLLLPIDRHLPNGTFLPFEEFNPNEGFEPTNIPVSKHFRSRGNPRAYLKYNAYTLDYKPDPAFTWWMLWKPLPDSIFICPEPMNIPVNVQNNHLDTLPELPPKTSKTFVSIFDFNARNT